MADFMDLVQQREAESLALNIAKVTMRPKVPSAHLCEDCGAPISEARRKAVEGVTCCVECQTLNELKNNHIRRH